MNKYISLILSSLLFVACGNVEEKKIQKDSIKTVFASKVEVINKHTNRSFSATASSNNQKRLSFKVAGNISNLNFDLGDEVKKGALLASLDSKPYELQVSQARYGLSEANASLVNAKSNYERVKKLYVNQNASVSDMDNARAAYHATRSKVLNIKKQLEYAKLQLSYTKLYAPISGFISSKFVQENENVAVGTLIVLLSDKIVDEVVFQVSENYINSIKKDEKVKIAFNSINKIFEGKVKDISKFASLSSKTYRVVVKIENSNKDIKSGMSADVILGGKKLIKEELLVPVNSVLNEKDGYFVYVLKEDDKNYMIKKTSVNVDKLTSFGYEIKSGLSSDDLVLKAGMSEVFEGMKVKIGNLKELGK